ncbi:MAG: cation-translocating P-type ATPase, partial [Firmicutes bacterium]|nr:cation-translocating P-type ATPase [Bacillota bacterium]
LSKEYRENKNPRIDEIPFDSDRKLMSTANVTRDGRVMYTKGALDNLLKGCTRILDRGKVRAITADDLDKINKTAREFAKGALRVLGYAFKPLDKNMPRLTTADESDLIFIGFTGMIDPPREEVFESIKTCKSAGIMVVMITGDHRDTAFAIAKQIGIADDEAQVITGAELEEMNDDVLAACIDKYRVYARVNPEHKVRIVKVFKSKNKIVAMTGDGVNDAPSIKAADIGIGMGITGTDVTKGAADVILTDDNFATIVTAVEEGRRTYANILKIIIYLVGLSFAEMILLTGLSIATMFTPRPLPFFNPLLILWINIVTDTLPVIALGSTSAERGIMKQKPNKPGGSLFHGRTGLSLLVYAMFMVALVCIVYFVSKFALGYDAVVAITMSYLVIGVVENVHAYNLCNTRESIFKENPFRNRILNWAVIGSLLIVVGSIVLPLGAFQSALGITQLTGKQWLFAGLVGLMMVPLAETYKFFLRVHDARKNITKKAA